LESYINLWEQENPRALMGHQKSLGARKPKGFNGTSKMSVNKKTQGL
jgi:hypothetical protein